MKINEVTLLQVNSKPVTDKATYGWNDQSFLLELEEFGSVMPST